MNSQQALQALGDLTVRKGSVLSEDEAAAIRYVVEELAKRNAGDGIHMTTVVSSRTGNGLVELRWGDMLAQMTPFEARQHGLAVIETAEAAEADGFFMHYLKTVVGVPIHQAAGMLQEFRSWRAEHNVAGSGGAKG